MSKQYPLDTHPSNILGKGVLSLEHEESLLARGIIFARWSISNEAPPLLITSHKPFNSSVARFFQKLWDGQADLSAYRIPEHTSSSEAMPA